MDNDERSKDSLRVRAGQQGCAAADAHPSLPLADGYSCGPTIQPFAKRGMKLKIVEIPTIKLPIQPSPGFLKKQLAHYKLDHSGFVVSAVGTVHRTPATTCASTEGGLLI